MTEPTQPGAANPQTTPSNPTPSTTAEQQPATITLSTTSESTSPDQPLADNDPSLSGLSDKTPDLPPPTVPLEQPLPDQAPSTATATKTTTEPIVEQPTQATPSADTPTMPVTPPADTTKPHAVPHHVTEDDVSPPPRSKRRLAMLVIALVILVLLSGSGVFAYMVTYQGLSTGNKDLDTKIAHAIQSVPGAPKTPAYIMDRSAAAHLDVSSAYLNMSLASENQDLQQMFGSNFEMVIEGPIDYGDTENPELALNIKLGTSLDADITYTMEHAYFRINKIPAVVYGFLGLTEENINDNPLLNRWIDYDTSGLDSNASQILDNLDTEEPTPTPMEVDSQVQALYDIFGEEVVLSKDDEGRYELAVEITPAVLDRHRDALQKAYPSLTDTSFLEMKETIDHIELAIHIDTGTYLIHEISAVSKLSVPNINALPAITPNVLGISSDTPLLAQAGMEDFGGSTANLQGPKESISSAFVLTMSDHGKDFDVSAPADATSYEDFMLEMSAWFQQIYAQAYEGGGSGIFLNQDASQRDTQRRSDLYSIVSASYQYASENNGSLPASITTTPTDIGTQGLDLESYLVPTYIAAIPIDPSDGYSAAETGYTLHLSAQNQLVATAESEVNPGQTIEIRR